MTKTTKRVVLGLLLLYFLVMFFFGCAGLGANKKADLMFDEMKLKPEWSEDREGDFHMNKVGTEFVWKFK